MRSAAPAQTVGCDQVIQQHGRPGGRLLFGVVAVPPAHLARGAPTGTAPWAYFAKYGIAELTEIVRRQDEEIRALRADLAAHNPGLLGAFSAAGVAVPDDLRARAGRQEHRRPIRESGLRLVRGSG